MEGTYTSGWMCNNRHMKPDLTKIREALEASWDEQTSYLAVKEEGNPALGQCYPTSRVVQHYFPKTEVVKGKVWNGTEEETHFWNILDADGARYHIDLSWQQFPPGSSVREYRVLDRSDFKDGDESKRRVKLLIDRVIDYLAKK